MKKKSNIKQWYFPETDYPKPPFFQLKPSRIPVVIIDKKGHEVKATFIDFSLPGFFGSDNNAIEAVAWRYKANKNKLKIEVTK